MSARTSPVVRGLLDTSVVIALERLDGVSLPEEPAISALTVTELAAGTSRDTGDGPADNFIER